MMTAPSSNWCTQVRRASAVSSQPSATGHVDMDALVRVGEQGSPLVVGFPRTVPDFARLREGTRPYVLPVFPSFMRFFKGWRPKR